MALVIIFLVIAIALGLKIKSDVDSFAHNLKSGSSVAATSKSANELSKDIDLLFSLANLPIIKSKPKIFSTDTSKKFCGIQLNHFSSR